MNTKYSPLLTLAVSACLSALVTHTAYASDIETLVGLVDKSLLKGPNVTLVIDTSGSMVGQVFVEGEGLPFDATQNYTGPFDIYESDGDPKRLLYSINSSNSTLINYLDEDDVDTVDWVVPEFFVCAKGTEQLLSSGIYSDRLAQFRRVGEIAIWSFLVAAEGGDSEGGQRNITECMADFGIHGDGSGAGSYPINFETPPIPDGDLYPWSDTETDPEVIDWQTTGSVYTFFTPNYLNWIHTRAQTTDPVVLTRLEIVQRVATELVDTLTASSLRNEDGLRLGLMRFSSDGFGGMVLAPTKTLVDQEGQVENHAGTLKEEIAELTPSSSTPLAETMFEAYRYHIGGALQYGDDSTPSPSVDSSLDGANYLSPIEAACQKNFVVLLTDGSPIFDDDANDLIEPLTGPCVDDSCLDELTNYMATADHASGFEDVQSVETFIIGFFADLPLLEAATTGEISTTVDNVTTTEPGYFLANNPEQLSAAFNTIFEGVRGEVATFTAPAVSVNSLNRFANGDTLYFTLYQPSDSGEPHWDGNLKAFRIGRFEGGNIEILDRLGRPAVDQATGLFFETAESVWGAVEDGRDISRGGVAARLSAQRKILSNLSSDDTLTEISRDNADAIGAIGGMPQGDELLELIDFMSGLDAEGGSRRTLGDPLHSEPLVINFGGGAEDLLLVFGTNDGFLHAIDPTQDDTTTNDMELFAFIPKALLPKQVTLKANVPSNDRVGSKVYGMDGPITAWIDGDADKDFIVEGSDNLYVYAGMRRGGRGYYAFDMTNRNSPTLEWVIDNTKANFANLGQTWSSASYAKIKSGPGADNTKDVLIFGGGYDPNQDGGNNSADTMGNSVYIVDALSGDLIWRAGGPGDPGANLSLADMTHSIPSEVRIIDTNGDGSVDRMYVGDMGAQVWRFDINEDDDPTGPRITGGRIADFSADGTANERRFYSAPSVSRYVERGRGFLAVALGSGYRAGPLGTSIDDKFYVIRDDFVYGPAVDADGLPVYEGTANALITEIDMQELSLGGIQDGSDEIGTNDFGKGWYLGLDAAAGEKSLSSAVTAEGRIFFTTYSPDDPELSCEPVVATGTGRIYGIDILTGLPALFDDADSSDPIASKLLGTTGIPPQPKLVFVAPNCVSCSLDEALPADISIQVGTQTFDVGLSSRPNRTYWVEF